GQNWICRASRRSCDRRAGDGGRGAPRLTRMNASPLWQRDFRLLWLSETGSAIGSQGRVFAPPLVALLPFGAAAAQVGLLAPPQYVLVLVVPAFTGIVADRSSCRPLLLAAHIGRAAAVAAVPAAWALHTLSMSVLYVVAFAVGAFNAVFDVAYLSYLP